MDTDNEWSTINEEYQRQLDKTNDRQLDKTNDRQ
jgi:hypothetical protein